MLSEQPWLPAVQNRCEHSICQVHSQLQLITVNIPRPPKPEFACTSRVARLRCGDAPLYIASSTGCCIECWMQCAAGVCRHIPRVYDYLWLAEDGMKMQGYNGSQLWDTAFAVQAIASTGLEQEFGECLRRAQRYVDDSQVCTCLHHLT